MSQIVLYDGKTDPKVFIMSFEAAIQSVGGDEAMMAKSLVMAITGIARTWYTKLPAGRTFSWEQLKGARFENFQGNYDDPIMPEHLFAVTQGTTETLRSYVKRQVCGLSEETIIDAAKEGLWHGLLWSKLSRRRPIARRSSCGSLRNTLELRMMSYAKLGRGKANRPHTLSGKKGKHAPVIPTRKAPGTGGPVVDTSYHYF